MKYVLDKKDGSFFIKIERDNYIKLSRLNNDIFLEKKKISAASKEKINFQKLFVRRNYLSGNEVYHQLANIRHIGFEVTDSCNLKCTYCIYGKYYENHDLRIDKNIDIRKAKKLLDYIISISFTPANHSLKHEIGISFYGGEPLLNMNFVKEIVNYIQSLDVPHINFYYMMTTNAVYLKKYIDFLSQYDFKLTISLDGDEYNDAYRKFPNNNPSFKLVYNNIKYVYDKYRAYFEKNINFNSVLHNLNNSQEVISFIYHEFNKIPYMSLLNGAGINIALKDEFLHISTPKPYIEDKNDSMDVKLGIESKQMMSLQKNIFVYSGNIYDNYNNLIEKEYDVKYIPTATCLPFSKRLFMTVNNKILPCERIGQNYFLAQVTDEKVDIDCDFIADKYNKYYNLIKNQCELCFNRSSCQKCMFYIQNLETNPVCDKFIDEDVFLKELQEDMKVLSENPILYSRFMTEILISK